MFVFLKFEIGDFILSEMLKLLKCNGCFIFKVDDMCFIGF